MHQISSQESKLFYKPKRLAKKIHFKKMKKTFYLGFELFQYCTPCSLESYPLEFKISTLFYQIKWCNLVWFVMPTELKVFNINISKQMPSTMTLRLLNDITIRGKCIQIIKSFFLLKILFSIGFFHKMRENPKAILLPRSSHPTRDSYLLVYWYIKVCWNFVTSISKFGTGHLVWQGLGWKRIIFQGVIYHAPIPNCCNNLKPQHKKLVIFHTPTSRQHHAEGMICNDHRSLPILAGGAL